MAGDAWPVMETGTFGETSYNLMKELLVFLCFIILFIMVIFAEKNLINWGFQIIIGVFLIVYMVVGNKSPSRTGLNRLRSIWKALIYYSAIILLVIITF